MAAASVVHNCLSSVSSSASSTRTSSRDQQSTTSELLQTMLNVAMEKSQRIKQELGSEDGEEMEASTSNTFTTHFPSSSSLSNIINSTALVSTNGIARIPIDASSTPSPLDQFKPSPSPPQHTYMQLHRPKTRILHNMQSNKLTLSRRSNYVHVDATVAVPRTDDLCSSGHVKNMSPSSTPLDQRVKPQFTSWLSEHFKQNGGQVKVPKQQSPSPQRSSLFIASNSSTKDSSTPNHSTSKLNQHKKLPQWLLQLTQMTASNSSNTNIISGGRTVEIPQTLSEQGKAKTNEMNANMMGRKSQRLAEKPIDMGNMRTVEMESRQMGIKKGTSDQYKELKTEISKLRKQMCRDRCRFVDESRAMRKEFSDLRETILLAVQLTQASAHLSEQHSRDSELNGKRRVSEESDNDNDEEPDVKRRC